MFGSLHSYPAHHLTPHWRKGLTVDDTFSSGLSSIKTFLAFRKPVAAQEWPMLRAISATQYDRWPSGRWSAMRRHDRRPLGAERGRMEALMRSIRSWLACR